MSAHILRTMLLSSALLPLGADAAAQLDAQGDLASPPSAAGNPSLQWQGRQHIALGDALVSENAAGHLHVSNLGSSGLDGVRIDLGDYIKHKLRIQFPEHQLEDGATMTITRRATLGPIAEYELSRETLTRNGDFVHKQADYTGLGSQTYTIIVHRGGQRVYTQSGLTGGYSYRVPTGFLIDGDLIPTLTQGECPPDELEECWEDPDQQQIVDQEFWIEDPLGGPPTAVGDQIFMVPDTPSIMVDSINALELTTSGQSSLTLARELILLENGAYAVSALDAALVTPDSSGNDGKIHISNLGSSGCDGFSIDLGAADSGAVTIDEIDLGDNEPIGAAVQVESNGVIYGAPNASLGTYTITKLGSGSYDVQADFTAIGSPTQRIQVLDHGTLIADITGHTGSAATVDNWPWKTGKLGGTLECFTSCHDAGSVFLVDGAVYVGDELRVLSEGPPGSVYSKSSLDLRFTNLSEGVLIGDIDSEPAVWTDLGCALPGAAGNPVLYGAGELVGGGSMTVHLTNAAPSALAGWFLAASEVPVAFKGGTIKAFPFLIDPLLLPTSAAGELLFSLPLPFGVPAGTPLVHQFAVVDAGAIFGMALSNAVRSEFQ